MKIRGRGVRRGPRKDRSDSRRPSQLCIDPPPQPTHTSIIPGI